MTTDNKPAIDLRTCLARSHTALVRLIASARNAQMVPTTPPAAREFYADIALVAGSLAEAVDGLALDVEGGGAANVSPDELRALIREELHALLDEHTAPAGGGK